VNCCTFLAEIAIRKAQDENDYSGTDNLKKIIHDPYEEHPEFEHYAGQLPE